MKYSEPIIIDVIDSLKIDKISLEETVNKDSSIMYLKGDSFIFYNELSFVLDRPRKLIKSINSVNKYHITLFKEEMDYFDKLSVILYKKINNPNINFIDIKHSNNITSIDSINFNLLTILNPNTRDYIENPLFQESYIIGKPVFKIEISHIYDCWCWKDTIMLHLKLDSFYRTNSFFKEKN